jgi:hypothetical protein
MYKRLFNQVVFLLTKPGQAWQYLAGKDDADEDFLASFLYPLIGLLGAAAFVGVFFTEDSFSLEIALKTAIKALFSSFGGFFLASYMLNEAWKGVFKREGDIKLCRRYVGYSSAAMFVILILFAFLQLLPLSQFFFLRTFILLVPTILIAWEGAAPFMRVEATMRLKLTLTASFLIVMLPEIINRLLFIILPGLRV